MFQNFPWGYKLIQEDERIPIQGVYDMNGKKLDMNNPVSPEINFSSIENSVAELYDESYLEPENACCSAEFTEGCIFVK